MTDLPDCPVFHFTGAAGERALVTVWDGKNQFENPFPSNIMRLVGGAKIVIVQVSTPVGRGGRSSVALSDVLAGEGFHGIIHWARDYETYFSIIKEFKDRHLAPAKPPQLPTDWKPEVVIIPCRG